MGSKKEKLALGAAIAAGIAGYIFTQTGSDGEDATEDQTEKNEKESYPASKLKTNIDVADIDEESSKDEKDVIDFNKKEDDVKPESTAGVKEEERMKNDKANEDVTPKAKTGDMYASPITESDIFKKNPKDDDDGQDDLEEMLLFSSS
eukprot:TRINITY_DN12452_c0_g1_i1.p1 TRINITY_DN12452_c0_g1~~TRINITY_DN12452_c0_g1_i1.p1  ORF type:complete len:148 (-),score=84.80 TRINITY_DN12452_c0_g1_i1:71-514(-)